MKLRNIIHLMICSAVMLYTSDACCEAKKKSTQRSSKKNARAKSLNCNAMPNNNMKPKKISCASKKKSPNKMKQTTPAKRSSTTKKKKKSPAVPKRKPMKANTRVASSENPVKASIPKQTYLKAPKRQASVAHRNRRRKHKAKARMPR